MTTNDGFDLNIKSLIRYSGTHEFDVFDLINVVALNYFKSISLMDSLKLIDETHSTKFKKKLQEEFFNHQLNLTDLYFFTIDATENLKTEIDSSIDPKLELRPGQKKKGRFGRFFGQK